MRRLIFLAAVLGLWNAEVCSGQTTGNLLRNSSFQDDWLTLVPENKNHHWCYSSEFYNRRDFNPDGWTCRGSWRWLNAEAPHGQRRLLLEGPGSLTQRVNWVLVHDSKSMGNMADAGGFPSISPTRSKAADKLVRGLSFRVRLKGQGVPAKAGTIEVSLCPPGGLSLADPLGSMVPPTALASAPLPEGTFDWRLIEVKLPASQWLWAVRAEAAKNPKEAAELAKKGSVLPGTVQVAIRYLAGKGQIELDRAELLEVGVISPNLLPNGEFEVIEVKGKQPGYPSLWEAPAKYRYFPGRLYYLFNTWHNGAFDNRGTVALDSLLPHRGRNSLRMIVPPGDEVFVASKPVTLNQKEPRLLEVHAWVKTDRLAMLHLDALDENGERLDSFPFIHMAPHSIGTDDWRLIRQVFRPRQPLKAVRILLCARGVNGYTLDDTGQQPQNNVVGTIWWDDVALYEPESAAAELAQRGVKPAAGIRPEAFPHLTQLQMGERLLGENVLTATLSNPGADRVVALLWEFTAPSGKKSQFKSPRAKVPTSGSAEIRVPYLLSEPCPTAYTEYRGRLSLLDDKDEPLASSELWFGTWTVPIDLELGALYLRPEQTQLVRMNLGRSAAAMKNLATIRLEVIRRGTRKVVQARDIPAGPEAVLAQRHKIPKELRDDFTNLLLTDLDVSALPVQPFNKPERNWLVRATARDKAGKVLGTADSPPFCRLAHDPPQPAVQSVSIKNSLLFVNGQPWMPWGVVYGHVPVYDGPADPGPGKYLDLSNLLAWGIYDRFTAATYTRNHNDFNCIRYVAGSVSDPKIMQERWTKDNLYASSAFVVPDVAFSLDELFKKAGGKVKLDANLNLARTAPMVVSVAPGIEEAFGLFTGASPTQLKGLEQAADYVRQATGKPVMVGHGGYWNRLEFEKVPFFDIFDPETEPWYPAQLHTDLTPLVAGKNKVIWLRPQMYEDVPYERWRYHVFVELMRGCRGWQIAHGPGDASLFRGLHGELEFFKPIVYSQDKGPAIEIQPEIEHCSRRHQGKTYVIAATTRGLTLGRWRWHYLARGNAPFAGKRCRVTADEHLLLTEANSYGADQKVDRGPAIHGIHYLPHARTWPKGTTLVQWVKLDEKLLPKNFVVLAKVEGRWTSAASWGEFDPSVWVKDPQQATWFLRSFYRHAYGFLGWDLKQLEVSKAFMPSRTAAMGKLPSAAAWARLEIPLDKLQSRERQRPEGALLDGIGFAHYGGKVLWGRTSLVGPKDKETLVWGDSLEHPPDELASTKIAVAGLKKGSRVRVLFEDRELLAEDGFFTDDFRGQDLYQRFGGGYGVGYGNGPVALHLYEIDSP